MDKRLTRLIVDVKKKYSPADKLALRVSYYSYKNISHTIRIRDGIIFVRISDQLKNAPDEIISALGIILFNKLFRRKVSRVERDIYRDYLNRIILPGKERIKRKASPRYKAQGRIYNLEEIFDTINRGYFKDSLNKPVLGWSQKRSRHRLGFYDAERNLLVISRIFDKKRAPQFIVEFLMYHEMLHMVIPVLNNNGRRVVHSKEFKKRERQFAEFEEAQIWLHKKLWRLVF